MTKETKRRPSVEFVRQTWRENKGIGFRELSKLMATQGYHASPSYLQGMKDKDDEWRAEYVAHRVSEGGPERTIDNLRAAFKEAEAVKAEHLIGIKARLISRLYEQILCIPISNVDEATRAVELLSRIDAQIHAMRGDDVRSGKAASLAAAAPASLLPRPQIGPIKPPAPANGAH